MQNEGSHIPLPLELLFPRLEAAGFALDTTRRLRAWRLLYRKGSSVAKADKMDGLKHLLCPVFARTLQEQRQFHLIFEQFWAECLKEWEELPDEEEIPRRKEGPTGKVIPKSNPRLQFLQKWGGGILAVFILIGLVWTVYEMAKPKAEIKIPTALFGESKDDVRRLSGRMVKEGDTLFFFNQSINFDSEKVRWEFIDRKTKEILHRDSSLNTSWIAKGEGKVVSFYLHVVAKPASNFGQDTSLWPDSLFNFFRRERLIRCSNTPEIGKIIASDSTFIVGKEYKFEVTAEKGCNVKWLINNETLSPLDSTPLLNFKSGGDTIVYLNFSKEDRFDLIAKVYRPGKEEFCYSESFKSINVGSNKPYLRLAELKYDQPRKILQVDILGWVLVFLPLLPAFWLLFRWWKKLREKPIEKTDAELRAKYPINEDAPFHIPYRSQESKINVPRDFFRIAEILRRREVAERREFDPQNSVRATIEAGGFPIWREQAKTRPAEFLFLLERSDERDQQFRLFERLVDFMTKREAPITTYFHDGRFDKFWNTDEEKSIDFQQLNRQFPQHRLVVLGTGHELVHDQRVLFRNASQAMQRWPRRLLLTPVAVSDWAEEEKLLHQIFPIFPADTEGILKGLEFLDHVEEYQPGTFDRWQEGQAQLRPNTRHHKRNLDDVETLRNIFAHDPDLLRWCQALAVTAHSDWALSIAIGEAIGVEVTHDRLLALTRLAWLRQNEGSDRLRLELLKILDPEDEKAARQAVAVELEQVEEQVENGFAALEWAANLAVQRFVLDPYDKAHKDSVRHLQQLGLLTAGQLEEMELVLVKYGLISGGDWKLKRWLDLKEDSWVTDHLLWAICLMPLSLVLAIWCYRYNQSFHSHTPEKLFFWQTTKTLDDKAIALNNQAVEIGQRIVLEKSYTKWLGYATDYQKVDSLWNLAIGLRRPEEYALADSNRIAFQYNKAVQGLNFFLADSSERRTLDLVEQTLSLVTGNIYLTDSLSNKMRKSYKEFDGLFLNQSAISSKNITTKNFLQVDIFHGLGLCNYFQNDTSLAQAWYWNIKEYHPTFFDTLSTTVNLEDLLSKSNLIEKPNCVLRVIVVDGNTNKYLPNIILKPQNIADLQTNGRGLVTYRFTGVRPTGKIVTTIDEARYEPWSGTLQPRTSTQIDTIRLISESNSGGTSGSGNMIHLPYFPWPPPQAYQRQILSDHLNNHARTLGGVNNRLKKALRANGYEQYSYFSTPGGFALVTQLEQFNLDGSSKSGADRWRSYPVGENNSGVWDYLKSFIKPKIGHFRVFVFVVTNQPYGQSSRRVSRNEAVGWLSNGLNRLPPNGQVLDDRHYLDVMVYEFENEQLKSPGVVSVQVHMQKSGLAKFLEF